MPADVDIDAETGTVRPRRVEEVRPVQLGSYPLNPQFATTVTLLALGFIVGVVFVEWQHHKKKPNKLF